MDRRNGVTFARVIENQHRVAPAARRHADHDMARRALELLAHVAEDSPRRVEQRRGEKVARTRVDASG